jgi:hypothetical protein
MVFPAAVLCVIATAALPTADAAAAGHAATPTAPANCLRVQTLTFSKAQQASALRYWTPARAKASKDFSQAALDKLGKARRLPESAAPTSATQCVPESSLRGAAAAIAPHAVRPDASRWNNNEDPYGTWSVEEVFLNSWMSCTIPLVDCSTNPLNDYAIIVLSPQDGNGVGDITGANGWTINQPDSIDNVTIAGIPGTSSDLLTTVTDIDTVTESGSTYREATTPGFTDGTSGGPWLTDFDTTTGLGTLIGDIGGYEEGGPSSGSPSYSDDWTSGFATVVSDAVSYEG